MRRGAWLLLLSVPCCRSDQLNLHAPELPDEITRGAILVRSANGTTLSASGIQPREADGSFRMRLGRSGDRVLFAGFTDQALLDRNAPDDATLIASPIGVAGARDPVLLPSWAAEASDDHPLAALETMPELTVDWLPRCPILFQEIEQNADGDMRCGPGQCTIPRRQTGCRLELDARGCSAGVLAADIDGRGGVDFPPSDSFGACSRKLPAADGASLTIGCSGGGIGDCEIDLYPPAPELNLTAARVSLATPNAPIAEGWRVNELGYLHGLIELGPSILVVTTTTFRSQECPTPDLGHLLTIDQETLAFTETATLPPCTDNLVADPNGTDFWATYGLPDVHLGRFSGAGHLLDDYALGGSAPHGMVAYALAHSVAGPAVLGAVLAPRTLSAAVDADAYVVLVDPATRQINKIPRRAGGMVRSAQLRDISATADGAFLVIDADERLVSRYLPSGEFNVMVKLPHPPEPFHLNLMRVVSEAPDRALASGSDVGLIYVVDFAHAVSARASVFEGVPADPVAMVRSLRSEHRWLVGSSARLGNREAAVSWFDVAGPRFLPGRQVIGVGPIHRMISDRSGRFWALLAWAGELLRLSE